ncbi:MCE family protein [Nocardia sp. NPDC050630]|uniref:MCE family protein n=1 Tax=Nocardia sp. NPDC050630 TaxID=3364321 RepID=UPI00379AAF0C
MRENLAGATVRFVAFMLVGLLAMFAAFAVFGQLRFDKRVDYVAEFANVSGLRSGNFVRIAGVEVGQVDSVELRPNNVVAVHFSITPAVIITEGTKAAVRYENLIGGRYMALEVGAGSVAARPAGATIPAAQTSPALDLDSLIGGFRPLFRALDPKQVNDLTGQLISIFQGQGGTVASFLAQTSQLTAALADRAQLVSSVIANLNVVVTSFADRSDQFTTGIDKLQQLISGLAERSSDLGAAVSSIDGASRTVVDLLTQARPPLQSTVIQTGRVANQIDSDRDYFDDLLGRLPETYKTLSRLGLYGDYFSFYLCDAVLKVNGPKGNPVYIKLAEQNTGRCTPK